MTQLRGETDQRQASARATRQPASVPHRSGVQALQRTIGNAATARLLADGPRVPRQASAQTIVAVQRCGPEPCDCPPEERVQRIPATVQRCGPEPCDCSPEERAQRERENEDADHPEVFAQRAVTESVVSEPSPLRANPSVCMVHLHGNETGALTSAQSLVPRCDANLVHLNNTSRHIHIPAGGAVCEADPNRIFADHAIHTLWSRWNPRGACARDPVKAAAIADIIAFRDQQLWPAIRRCKGVPGTLEEERAAGGVCREGAPVAAFHNNDPSPSIDILAYCPGPGGPPGCGGALGSEARGNRATDVTSVPINENPNIAPGQDKDDFFLVTNKNDFDALKALGRNVVLQAPGVRDDGSLSVRFAFGRYANVEAELGRSQSNNDAMGEQAITQLGATCRPPGSPPGGTIQRDPEPDAGATTTTPAAPTEETGGLSAVLDWLRRLLNEIVRVLEQAGTSPAPLPREAPPRNLPKNCRTFADQSELDVAKARISSTVIGRMSDRDVISWIVGITPPPTSVTREATEQRDCMLAAIRAAARRPGSGITLPAGQLSHSDRRSFAQQRAIWQRKFTFADRAHGGRPFDRISQHARDRCGAALGSGPRWNPDNADHRYCWLSVLTADERQQEILQASSAPGISRHHWGTDFDLFDPDMNPAEWEAGGAFADEYSWLLRNASTYGFIQSFTPMSTFMTVGYIEERWHWSYYPAAQALLEFARGHQADIEARLVAEWGTSPEFSFIRTQWRNFMFNVNERGQF